MAVLNELLRALTFGRISIIDLTTCLTSEVPVLQLPQPFANTVGFSLE